jgi:signal transduction histidine kinase
MLERLHDATRLLVPLQHESSLAQTIADSARTVFEAPGAALFLLDRDIATLAAVSGTCAMLEPGLRLVHEESAAWRSARAGALAAVGDSDDVPAALRAQRPALALPLSPGSEVAGILWIRIDERPSGTASSVAATFATLAGAVLANARLYGTIVAAHDRRETALATLAHEFRNPLGAIVNALSALERVSAPETGAVRLREVIDRQAKHLTRLVEDMLDVARIRHEKLRLHREELDLREVVGRALEALRASGRAVDYDVHEHLGAGPVVVHGDSTRLEQVVRNLLDNAVKYSPARTAIDVSVEEIDGQAIVTVRDEGIGITGALLPRLFEPFAQGKRAMKLSAGGLGLGLPLVRAIVEEHGGRVTARSDGAGKGSEFVVCLPVARAATQRQNAR